MSRRKEEQDITVDARIDAQIDGCSGGVSWFYRKFLRREVSFLYCCDEHDLAYEEGGSKDDRRLADRRFRECMKESGRPFKAWLFWVFVRAGGWLFWEREK